MIREAKGRLLAGFSEQYGFGTNTEAKLRALTSGVRFCLSLGYSHVEVEGDSYVIINWVQRRSCTVWYLWDFFDEL